MGVMSSHTGSSRVSSMQAGMRACDMGGVMAAWSGPGWVWSDRMRLCDHADTTKKPSCHPFGIPDSWQLEEGKLDLWRTLPVRRCLLELCPSDHQFEDKLLLLSGGVCRPSTCHRLVDSCLCCAGLSDTIHAHSGVDRSVSARTQLTAGCEATPHHCKEAVRTAD